MADKVEEELVLGHAQHLLPNLKQPDKYIFAGTTNKKALFRQIMKMRRYGMHAKTKKNTAKYFVKPHNPSTGRTRLLRHIVHRQGIKKNQHENKLNYTQCRAIENNSRNGAKLIRTDLDEKAEALGGPDLDPVPDLGAQVPGPR